MSIADILDKAAEYCGQGWCQGHYAEDADGCEVVPEAATVACVCVKGAIFRALAGPGSLPVLNFLAALLPEPRPNQCSIAAWNDSPRRTQPEVVAKLREAAAKAREQGL